jgi:uncharacterized protein YqeY
MKLTEQIDKDFIAARKHRDPAAVDVLNMIRTAIQYKEIENKKPLVEAEVIAVLSHAIKQRREAAEQFTRGQRPELAVKEQKEIEIIQRYLPAQLSGEEIKKEIQTAIKTVHASSLADLGKVMGAVMPKMRGRVDGALVQRLVRAALSR